ncbi:MAG: hypothetical protein JF598_06000 [Streptomyces sp.]|nr:hypothetical protein [Streptomyces sp.]
MIVDDHPRTAAHQSADTVASSAIGETDVTTGRQFRVDRGGTFTGIVVRRPDGRLLTVGRGPDAGPACCRGGGPLAVTDANVKLGRLQPAHVPRAFGPNSDQPLDPEVLEW